MANLKYVMQGLSLEAQYDENAKNLLAQKVFLSHILVRTVEEFRGMDPRDVEELIEGEPSIGETPLEPGFTNVRDEEHQTLITGMNTENKVRGEGVRYFDVLFYVRTKDGLSKIIVNLEAQKAEPSVYDVEMRAIFYAVRELSSQLDREFTGSNYNELKKVYSIWICMNCEENTFNRIGLQKTDMIGSTRWKDMYEVLNVEIIRMRGEVDENLTHELHRLLGAMFLPGMRFEEKQEIMEREFGINMEIEGKDGIKEMCNLGEGIREQALEEGREEGREEGQEELVLLMIRNNRTRGVSEEQICEKLIEELGFSKEVAERYLAK